MAFGIHVSTWANTWPIITDFDLHSFFLSKTANLQYYKSNTKERETDITRMSKRDEQVKCNSIRLRFYLLTEQKTRPFFF